MRRRVEKERKGRFQEEEKISLFSFSTSFDGIDTVVKMPSTSRGRAASRIYQKKVEDRKILLFSQAATKISPIHSFHALAERARY